MRTWVRKVIVGGAKQVETTHEVIVTVELTVLTACVDIGLGVASIGVWIGPWRLNLLASSVEFRDLRDLRLFSKCHGTFQTVDFIFVAA